MGVRTQNQWLVGCVAFLLLALVGCRSRVERPFGVVRIGALKNIPVGKIRYFEEYALLLQRDSKGIRAMSTLHPATFTPLDRTIIDDHVLFRDPSTGTLFDESGRLQNVTSAKPAKGALSTAGHIDSSLTHYRVLFDRVAGEFEVLVVVGDVRPIDWRLKVPV